MTGEGEEIFNTLNTNSDPYFNVQKVCAEWGAFVAKSEATL